MSDHQPYSLGRDSARLDWLTLSREVADGAQPPPENLCQVLGEAAGGLPEYCTARSAMKATAEVLKQLGKLP